MPETNLAVVMKTGFASALRVMARGVGTLRPLTLPSPPKTVERVGAAHRPRPRLRGRGLG